MFRKYRNIIVGTAATLAFAGLAVLAARGGAANFFASLTNVAAETFLATPRFIAEVPLDAGNAAPSPAERAPAPSAPSVPPVVTEICAGTEAGVSDEFVELFNPGATAIDLTGWTIAKRSATGRESTLVAAQRLKGKTIPPRRHFLLANGGGYAGNALPDVLWPKSSTLAYAENAIIVYNGDAETVAEIPWKTIPKGQSMGRADGDGGFALQAPNPENGNDR